MAPKVPSYVALAKAMAKARAEFDARDPPTPQELAERTAYREWLDAARLQADWQEGVGLYAGKGKGKYYKCNDLLLNDATAKGKGKAKGKAKGCKDGKGKAKGCKDGKGKSSSTSSATSSSSSSSSRSESALKRQRI